MAAWARCLALRVRHQAAFPFFIHIGMQCTGLQRSLHCPGALAVAAANLGLPGFVLLTFVFFGLALSRFPGFVLIRR